jgi:PAS domain S-box-containing protein
LRFVYAGGRELEQAGFQASAIIGKRIDEALPEVVAEELIPPCTEALNGHSVEFDHVFDAHIYSMFAGPLDRDELGVTTVLLVSRNITRQRAAEEETADLLRRSQEATEQEQRLRRRAEAAEVRFRALFDSTADAILVSDDNGNYLNANQAACNLLGYTREELLQRQVPDVVVEPEMGLAEFQLLKEQGSWRGEIDARHRDGKTIPVEANATTVPMPNQRAYVVVFREISQRREVEAMQKELLATVAHELRNPLTPIIGFARILQRMKTYDESVVADILQHAEVLERRLDDLLETSRVDTGQIALHPSRTDLLDLVQTMVRQTQALNPAYTIRLEAPTGPIIGWWDRQRIEQVMTNLVSNAIKYSPQGGDITISIRTDEQEVHLAIVDRGIGIPEEQLPMLFSRFFRAPSVRARSVKGFGLGLYVARGLIEAHGGKIWASSEGVGHGSTFEFSLPFHYLPSPADAGPRE